MPCRKVTKLTKLQYHGITIVNFIPTPMGAPLCPGTQGDPPPTPPACQLGTPLMQRAWGWRRWCSGAWPCCGPPHSLLTTTDQSIPSAHPYPVGEKHGVGCTQDRGAWADCCSYLQVVRVYFLCSVTGTNSGSDLITVKLFVHSGHCDHIER